MGRSAGIVWRPSRPDHARKDYWGWIAGRSIWWAGGRNGHAGAERTCLSSGHAVGEPVGDGGGDRDIGRAFAERHLPKIGTTSRGALRRVEESCQRASRAGWVVVLHLLHG